MHRGTFFQFLSGVFITATVVKTTGKMHLSAVHRMPKLVLNVKYLLLLSFLTADEFYNLGHI